MRRTEQERRRLAIATALRNARRLLLLSDSPLLEETTVAALAAERYPNAILAQELALSDLVLACGERVLGRIRGDRRLEREATVLSTVLAGGSVQEAAKRVSRSREHIANTAWRTVTEWVLDEFQRGQTVRYTGKGDGKELGTRNGRSAAVPSP